MLTIIYTKHWQSVLQIQKYTNAEGIFNEIYNSTSIKTLHMTKDKMGQLFNITQFCWVNYSCIIT